MTDAEWLARRILDRIERDGGKAVHLSSLIEEIETKRPVAVATPRTLDWAQLPAGAMSGWMGNLPCDPINPRWVGLTGAQIRERLGDDEWADYCRWMFSGL